MNMSMVKTVITITKNNINMTLAQMTKQAQIQTRNQTEDKKNSKKL